METFNNYIESKTTKVTKPRIVVIQGSPRTKKSCSGGDSKSGILVKKILAELGDGIKTDVFDLCIRDDEPKVQPCKGCISTSNGYQCHYPCSCYIKNSEKEPDYMHDKDVYRKMEKADGFIVFSPVHWYAVTTQVKAFFDRLVCVNLTLTVDQAKKYMGENIKNPDVTRKLEISGQYSGLLKNHYEGKVGAFFIHGNNGANDYANKKIPLSLINDHKEEKAFSIKDSVMPIVHQCRYSGIYVPDNLIQAHHIGENDSYAEGNDKFKEKEETAYVKKGLQLFQQLVDEINKLKTK